MVKYHYTFIIDKFAQAIGNNRKLTLLNSLLTHVYR